MPPKVKTESAETTELQVINLDTLNPALLPELATFKEIQLKVVEDNPFVAITDTASRDLAKKHRTARVSARTALQAQDRLISSKFNAAKDKAKGYIAELIAYTQPGEIEQQKEIDRDEAVLEEKRQEKARLEKARIESIKQKIDDYVSSWKDAFNLMVFEKIEEVSANFYESYTTYDLTVLEEFEALFPSKVEELTQYLSDKTLSLSTAENARLETLRLAEEAKLLAEQKAELEAKQKLADEAEAKAKKEREDFEKEKAEFEKKQAIAVKKETFEKRKQILLDLGFTYRTDVEYNFSLEGVWSCFHEQIDDCTDEWFEEYLLDIKDAIARNSTPSPETLKGIEVEDKAIELIQNLEVLVPEETTVNVCVDLPKEITWESIIKEFQDSGEKSYSKFLIDNYNVPTKL